MKKKKKNLPTSVVRAVGVRESSDAVRFVVLPLALIHVAFMDAKTKHKERKKESACNTGAKKEKKVVHAFPERGRLKMPLLFSLVSVSFSTSARRPRERRVRRISS